MYHPTTRVLTVLELLQSHQQMSGSELAERLEVDVRSVRRYIVMLQELGIPVEAVRGRYGAYRLRRGFKLPPLMFTEHEALALTLGLLVSRHTGLSIATPAVEGALAKIDRVLPETLRARVQAVQETLILDIVSSRWLSSAPASLILLTISTAAQQEQRVWIQYRTAQTGITTEREIDPYGLIFHAGVWYMVGYCHLRQDLRVFRLDRMLNAEPREETFTRPSDFDSLAFLRRSMGGLPGTWQVEVILEISMEEATRLVPVTVGMLEQVSQGVLLKCYADSLAWIAHYLVSLRCPLIICKPPELHDALRDLAYEILQTAEREE